MARIKAFPEDFIVKELYADLELVNDSNAEWAYFVMMKKDLTTLEACQRIAKAFDLNLSDIKYAGNKDKKAITFQLISLPNHHISVDDVENTHFNDIKLKFFGYGKKPLKLGQLKGNYFEIRVRNIEHFTEFQKLRLSLNKVWIPNYFDDQRFSKYNVQIGRAIVKSDFQKAIELILSYSFGEDAKRLFGYWNDFDLDKADKLSKIVLKHLLKQPKDFVGAIRALPSNIALLFIHAYQSYLFNKTLDLFIDAYFKDKFKIKIMDEHYNASTEHIKFLEKVKLPLPGFATDITKYQYYDVGSIFMQVMANEDLKFRDFVIHSYPLLTTTGSDRDAFILVDLKVEGIKEPVFKFQLPSGSYATMVIKTIFGKIGEDVEMG